MTIKRRTYNPRLVKHRRSYYLNEIAELFDVHKNVVQRWTKAGLATIDRQRPFMVHGSELIRFLNDKQRKRKQPCAADEFYCCKCRAPRKAWERAVDLIQFNARSLRIQAICSVCSTKLNRLALVKSLPELLKRFAVQTFNGEHITESFNPLDMCDLEKGE